MKQQCSKSFSHYWKLGNFEKNKPFKALRKTAETRLWLLLGDLVKGLNRHKNQQTAIDHYYSQKEIVKELEGVRMFNIR